MEHRSRTRSGNGRPTPSLGQPARHGHKAGSSTRTRTLPSGRGISASAQLPHTAEGWPVSAPANQATRLRGSVDHRGGAPCCARPRLNGCAYQYESNQEVLGGRGSALGQARGHWGRQLAYPNSWFPTPMRVSRSNTARRTRKGPAAGNRSVKRTPRAPPPPTQRGCARRGGGAKRTPRTRAHSPGPLGISARSAASRSGTS